MFSGIIQNTGTVVSVELNGTTKGLLISSPISAAMYVDQSIAHDGCCLTVVEVMDHKHRVEVVKETLFKTTFSNIQPGRLINLETSLTLSTLLDGHLVQGHVDTVLKCLHISDEKGSWKFRFELPKEYASLLVPQGSICLNGVSLTVAHLGDDTFEVAVIPYSYEHTNFRLLQAGDLVNAEFDLVGKYLLRQARLLIK